MSATCHEHEHQFVTSKPYCDVVNCTEPNPDVVGAPGGRIVQIFEWSYVNEGEQFNRILDTVLPAVLESFNRKNQEYQENAQTLGVKGQFADMWRKTAKLRTALWDEQPEKLKSESAMEVLWDLVAHCLLTLDMLPEEYK